MSGESFYNAASPEEAMRIYRESHENLYDRMKEAVIRKAVLSIYGEPGLSSLNVLEVGAAGGIFTEFFLAHGAKVFCVDVCEPILRKNKELHPEIEIAVGDATTLRLGEAGRFDLVFVKDVIEHIADDRAFLENMNAHLKEGGLVVLNTQNSFCLNYLIQGAYRRLRGDRGWLGWDPTHLRFYNPRSLARKLREAGFAPFAWFGSYYVPYRPLAERLGGWAESKIFCLPELTGLSRRYPVSILGWNIGAAARKIRPAKPPGGGSRA